MIVDPGFGFAKTPAHNLELIRRLGELLGLGHAVLVGPSRKSTIALLTGDADQAHRLERQHRARDALGARRGAHAEGARRRGDGARAARRGRGGARHARRAARAPDSRPDRVSPAAATSTDIAWV